MVYFDDGGKKFQNIPIIYPGQETSISPAPDAPTDNVKITADHRLNLTKQYSTEFRTPGLRIK